MKQPSRLLIPSIFVIACILAVATCDNRSRGGIVHIVLPDGYRGFFWVIVDLKAGQTIKSQGRTVTLTIPSDGILKVKDAWFLYDWHRVTAEQAGERIKTVTDDGPHGTLMVWSLATSSEGISTFLVGTSADRDAYYAHRSHSDRELTTRLQERNGPIAATGSTRQTLRAITRDEIKNWPLPVPAPTAATNIEYAEYAEFAAYEVFVRFEAPPDICRAYAVAILKSFNGQNPKRTVSAALTPVEDPGRDKVSSSELSTPWFKPEAIHRGLEGGARGSHSPKVWVDSERGVFYYQYTD